MVLCQISLFALRRTFNGIVVCGWQTGSDDPRQFAIRTTGRCFLMNDNTRDGCGGGGDGQRR